MSVDFKGATEFLKAIASAATTVAGALETVGTELTAAKAVAEAKGEFWRLPGAKGSPSAESMKVAERLVNEPAAPKGIDGTDTGMIQWMRKNVSGGVYWEKAVADYICYKEGSALKPEPKGPSVSYKMPNLGPELGDRVPQGLRLAPPRYKTTEDLKAKDPLPDLEAKEQDDLARDAAEYDAIPPQISGRPEVDTTAMAAEISRKQISRSRDEIISDYQAAKTEKDQSQPQPQPTVPKPERLPIEVFNDLLSTGATIGGPSQPPQKTPAVIKVVFVGQSGSGKSRALAKLTGKDSDQHAPTIGVNYDFYVNAKGHKIQIWDTAGQERFRTITNAYFKGVDHCILFSGHYLKQNDLDLFQPETCFKRFTTQEKLKEYLDSL